MNVREITTVGNPVLRRRALEIPPGQIRGPEVQQLIDDLIDTMREAGGAGLAANQIGERQRVAVAEVRGNNPRYPYKPEIPLTVFVNPQIEFLDDDVELINEGCLSIPNLRGTVPRHMNIRVTYLDRDGSEHSEVKRGLTAGTFQHEVDHLDGILLLDRVTDPATYTTWQDFDRFHRAEFERHARAIVARLGS
jgi:peptide deformylase